MTKVTLNRSYFVTGCILLVALSISDVVLSVHSLRQNAVIERLSGSKGLVVAQDGQAVPVLTGRKLATGQTWSVVPSSTSRLAVLVFRESCRFCEENWKNWDNLFGTRAASVPTIFITEDANISDAYKQKHPLLLHRTVLLGVDPKLLASLRPGLTPQTIFISSGKVGHDWPGVLAGKDVTAITKALSEPN